jgi:hypothetical protein
MPRKRKGRFTSLYKTPFESVLPQAQQPAGKTAHGKAHQKMLDKEAVRIRREQEADKPKPDPRYTGMAMGLTVGACGPYFGMLQGLAGVTDLTEKSHPPIDLTDVPALSLVPAESAAVPVVVDCGTFSDAKTSDATAEQVKTKLDLADLIARRDR